MSTTHHLLLTTYYLLLTDLLTYLLTYCTKALDKLQLDAKQRAKSGEFEKACRVEKARRESDGVGDSYENMQPVKAPTLTLGMRLERLCWPSTL